MGAPVAFVGLGAMGAPMAAALARAGHDLRLHDVRPAAAAALAAETGATAVDSAAAAARGAAALLLMVATPAQAEAALFGRGGAAEQLAPGAVVVLLATVGREAAAGLAGRLAERGVELLDAPVSGGVARARTGELLIMAGGSAAVLATARPLLEPLARELVHCGERAGDGQAVKLVNQLLCGAHIAVAGEALAYAEALGLDPAFVLETVSAGAAQSFMLSDRGPRMVSGQFEPVRSALDIFVKDLRLVLDAADGAGFAAPLARTALDRFERGSDSGWGAEDDAGIVRVSRAPSASDAAANAHAGFGGAFERGTRPAVVVVDFSVGFTDAALPTGADMDREVERTALLLDAARASGLPVFFTTIAYAPGERSVWLQKARGMADLVEGSPLVELDVRLGRRPAEPIVVKQGASAFFGTDLALQLGDLGVDTVVLCGATTSGCVRATAVDSVQSGFATLVVRDCVADRAPAAHAASLFDLESKYADVIPMEEATAYLTSTLEER